MVSLIHPIALVERENLHRIKQVRIVVKRKKSPKMLQQKKTIQYTLRMKNYLKLMKKLLKSSRKSKSSRKQKTKR